MKFYTNVIQWGGKIFYRGIKDGRAVTSKEDFGPSMFLPSKNPNSEWKSLYEQPLEEMKFDNVKDAKDFLKQYKDVSNFEVHGMDMFQYQYINKNFPGQIEYNVDDMVITSMDIETSTGGGFPNIQTANEEILLIALTDRSSRKTTVFGTKSHTPTGKYEYKCFKDESTMLKQFVLYWQANYPDIVTGWNTDTFDFPYLINRIVRILDEDWAKKLSPFNAINERTIEVRGKEVQTYDIIGVSQLDMLQLYKKFTYTTQESYALGNICQVELGHSKVENPYDTFQEFYEKDWDLFVSYNAKDAILVLELDDKMRLIELIISMAYLVKCNFKDVFGPVKTWDVFIYNHLHSKKIAIPPQKKKLTGTLEGAWVKTPTPGMYGWHMSFDFASLYPNIIRQWNLSPETLLPQVYPCTVKDVVDEDVPQMKDCTIAANGSTYRNDKLGFFPELMSILLDGRKIAKKKMLAAEQEYQKTKDKSLLPKISALNNEQMASKILANAGYGACSNEGFRYYDLKIAEAITLTGQAADQHVEKTLNKLMNRILKTTDADYITYGDTDSLYLNVDALVTDKDNPVEYLDKLGDEVFQTAINKSVDTVYELCNCYQKTMSMKREAIASKALWVAKKRYAMLVHNSEGVVYDPPKLKVMGLDLVRSSTPKLIQDKLRVGLQLMFDSGEKAIQEYTKKVDNEIRSWSPEDLAFPRGTNDIEKYTLQTKSVPIHIRAALLYNKHIDKKKYDTIQSKDKIKFIYLKMPNPIKSNIIGFPTAGNLPKELGLHPYIDYDTMIEKSFLTPLRSLTTACNWRLKEIATLDDFFS